MKTLLKPEKLLEEFFSSCPIFTYSRGEKILRPKENVDFVYLVKDGYVRIYKIIDTDQEITLNWYNPKKQKHLLLGHTPFINDYFVSAFTSVTLNRAKKEEFEHFKRKNKLVENYLLQDIQISMQQVIEQVEWLSIPNAYIRIKAILYSLARRIGYLQDNKLLLDNREKLELNITHQLIASLAGLSRETVTIQINRLISEGYLSRIGKNLVIEDLESLHRR